MAERDAEASERIRAGPLLAVRAHDLLVTMLGRHVYGLHDGGVSAGTFIELLGAAGVGEHAARSALSRAVDRGLLSRQRQGRRASFSITPRLRVGLREGEPRIYEVAPVIHGWRGDWSLLSFSLPESRRADRHRLRVRLRWAGFGMLRDGLWIAPGRVSLDEVLSDLPVREHVTAFHGSIVPHGDARDVVAEAWDLPAIAAGFDGFLQRWSVQVPLPEAEDDFVRDLYLVTDWRLLLRDAPPLPAELLPDGWPGEAAARVFRRLHQRLRVAADERFQAVHRSLPSVGTVDRQLEHDA